MDKYTIGLDFGTLSGRAVLVNVKNGEEVATSVASYPHGVITDYLPNTSIALGKEWALQDPQDYLDVLFKVITEVIQKSGVLPKDIIGVGVDFTACTILPIDKYGEPLCFEDEYNDNPHSYVKLWKHHAAQYAADRFNMVYKESGEDFLDVYGGKVSSEWMFPKLIQIIDESPEVYRATHSFIEAGDWIVLKLTGNEKRNSCAAGFKANWNGKTGYPSGEFLKRVNPLLVNAVKDKLSDRIYPAGDFAGYIRKDISGKTGLSEETAVSVASIDAHVAVPGMGVTTPGKMVLIIGTSTCNILLWDKEIKVPGISGVVKDGVVPGYYGYEAGQAAVGDIFDWFVKNSVPETYFREAEKLDVDIFEYLSKKASKLKPGESGILCLDWLNGNRSTLNDANLSGMILGLTLATKPEEIYRALIEATAFGQQKIIEVFREHGVGIDELYACGGIATKNPLLMQIYADVMNMNIKISASDQTTAVGSAIFASVAAGKQNGGYDHITDAARAMGRFLDTDYKPIKENHKIYQEIYEEYENLYDYFGKMNPVMRFLKGKK